MGKAILLAEDDRSISEVMQIILEDEGYSVTHARNKIEITNALKKMLPDLIFLDIRLGGEDGEQIASELRTGTETSSIPLLILSADSKTENIAARVGADGYLLKPFDMDELIAITRRYLH